MAASEFFVPLEVLKLYQIVTFYIQNSIVNSYYVYW